MGTFSVTELLRPGVLDGVTLMLAREGEDSPLGEALADAAGLLSAELSECPLPPQDEESLAGRLREAGPPDVLVVDAAGSFSAVAGTGTGAGTARTALSRTLQVTWEVTRVVAAAMIEQQRPGRIVFVSPPEDGGSPDTSTCSRAARAGLENLARTTSIEWARYRITTVAIAPGPDTSPGTVAALCAYLASPAGSYFSGCVLALDGDGRVLPAAGRS